MTTVKLKDRHLTKEKRKHNLSGVIATIILVIGSVVVLMPLAWMLATALKSDAEIYTNTSFIPQAWAWDNFSKAWNSAPFGTYLKNTLFLTVVGMFASLLSNSLVAYGFARINFKGRNVLFSIVLATMMIPGIVTMIPSYILFSKIKWVGTYLPLLIPAFGGSAYYIFLLRQFFMGIPMAYSEAAKLEGASELQIYSNIVLPMSKPILITIAVFEFNSKWNDFMGPLLYLNDEKMYTLQIGLRTFKGDFGMIWQQFMAASLLVLLPSIIVFFFMQKYIIQSVAVGGIKG